MINSFVYTITVDSQPIVLWCIAISEWAFNIEPLNMPGMKPFIMAKSECNAQWYFAGDVPEELKMRENILSMLISINDHFPTVKTSYHIGAL